MRQRYNINYGFLVMFVVGLASGYFIKQETTTLPSPIAVATPSVSVCFTPSENCLEIILSAVSTAQESVYVQAYALTSEFIIGALKEALERGVLVEIILDGRTHYPEILLKSSLPLFIETLPGLQHNKVLIIDHKTVLTGSYNLSPAAQHRNAENLLKIDNPEIAALYFANWNKHKQKALPLPKLSKKHIVKKEKRIGHSDKITAYPSKTP